jgi:L-ribulokinase
VRAVAGVDFGTLSVRVTLFDENGRSLANAAAEYPLHRRQDDPDYATQSHDDHMAAFTAAMQAALRAGGVAGRDLTAIAVDTTGSSVIVVGEGLRPLGNYYLWCDHRAKAEAEEITALAHREGLEAIHWCGGVYSHEWGFAKLLHWLRHNPDKRDRCVTALEHCDMAVATLTGVTRVDELKRSVCAMGHKWMWNPRWGGLPPQAFLSKVDPLLDGIRDKMGGSYRTSDHVAGGLTPVWAERIGAPAGIPVTVGAFDAHWDALGAGCRVGDVVNVVGTSTCIIAMAPSVDLIPGLCGIVPGSVDPKQMGIEAGLSATGDIFDAIARRAGTSIKALSAGLERFRPGQTGLLRLTWDNGDRTVLVRSDLSGVTFGWNLLHTAQDELFAAIEGTAFHTRLILERMSEHGVPIERVINGGGIPQQNAVLNQVYANVLGKPVLVPNGAPTGFGAGIFASLAAGFHPDLAAAQAAICLPFDIYEPESRAQSTYERLYRMFRQAYFGLGDGSSGQGFAHILPELRAIARETALLG